VPGDRVLAGCDGAVSPYLIIGTKASDEIESESEALLRTNSDGFRDFWSAAAGVAAFEDTLEGRLRRAERARREDQEFARWLRPADWKIAEKISDCGSWLLFRRFLDVAEGRAHLVGANLCKQHLLCRLCAIRRSAKLLRRYVERLATVLVRDSSLRGYLVTLTVKDGPDLAERFAKLRSGLKRLSADRRRALSRRGSRLVGRGRPTEYAKALGGVWSIEVKRGDRSGQWHPHCHQQWLCRESPDQSRLSDEWREITGDSFIVDVRPFRYNMLLDGGAGVQDVEKQLQRDCLEITKYGFKFEAGVHADRWECFRVLRCGKQQARLAECFGSMRAVSMSVRGDDLCDGWDDLDRPYVEACFRWAAGHYGLESWRTNSFAFQSEDRYVARA
jgi:hypothetical protein